MNKYLLFLHGGGSTWDCLLSSFCLFRSMCARYLMATWCAFFHTFFLYFDLLVNIRNLVLSLTPQYSKGRKPGTIHLQSLALGFS